MTGVPFSERSFTFFGDLERNNNKPWFEDHRADYEADIRGPALEFIDDVAEWFESVRLPYVADPKRVGGSLGRIHRDIRFSKDKSPYNTHAHMGFHHKASTEDHPLPGIGIWWDKSGASVGAGCWMGGTPMLNRIRDRIVAEPEAWTKAKGAITLEHRTHSPSLKTAPRGYAKDHPMIEDLKRTTFAGDVPMTNLQFTSQLMPTFQKSVRQMQPFVGFLDDALA